MLIPIESSCGKDFVRKSAEYWVEMKICGLIFNGVLGF